MGTAEAGLVAAARAGLPPFAEAVFATPAWTTTLRELSLLPEWPPIAASLLAPVFACDREYPPKERCVLEVLLSRHDRIDELARVVTSHPQRELRIWAMHGLLASQAGVDAAAALTNDEADVVVRNLRAKAAILRGDAPDPTAPPERRRALLAAMLNDATLFDRHPGWLPFAIDALFEPGLASLADMVLSNLPEERWKPQVRARKRAEKARRAPGPSAAEREALDEELKNVAVRLAEIVAKLRAEGYAFEGTPLSPPLADADKKLKKLERRVGKIPLALARFWALVGAVDLRGNHPRWAKKTFVSRGDEPHWLADPLVVVPLDAALAEALDDPFDVREAPAALKYTLGLSGDDVTKANFSGGVVSVATPSDLVDPPLSGAEGTFLEMLRRAVEWQGFPGFATIEDRPGIFSATR